MPHKLHSTDAGFQETLKKLLDVKLESSPEVNASVEAILAAVRAQGDVAVCAYTREFDSWDAEPPLLQVPQAEIDAAPARIEKAVLEALELAAVRIADYHARQMPNDHQYEDECGNLLGWRWTPLDAVGLYVPGGLAAYPSSVLMNAVPANVAGVKRMAMVVPTPGGVSNPLVLAAAKIANISEIYRVGGAQAIGALAYGTGTIKAVDTIVGPGNAYVAAAKRQVFGTVGIDMIAGPSEILVIADNVSNPRWVAADLLSQAEHDPAARSILVVDDAEFADDVVQEVERLLDELPRKEISQSSWRQNGIVITCTSLEEAVEVANVIAPEHLELAVEKPESLLPLVRHAGAIFLGRHTPEAIGDYMAGPSHVLPTSGSARFSSGLSVFEFLKRSSLIGCSKAGFLALSAVTEDLASAEGLAAHAASVAVRHKNS